MDLGTKAAIWILFFLAITEEYILSKWALLIAWMAMSQFLDWLRKKLD